MAVSTQPYLLRFPGLITLMENSIVTLTSSADVQLSNRLLILPKCPIYFAESARPF